MSIDGVIRRRDRKPLGNPEEVKAQLSKAFPGTQFTFVRDGGVDTPIGFSFASLLLWLFAIRQDYPHWGGSFEGDEFIAVFTVGTRPAVKSVRVTLYGRGTTNANVYFATLFKQTGWRTKF
jgi:hypothetical protein